MVAPPMDEIRHLAQRIVESERLELVDVEFKAGKSRSLLRIFIDKTGGVTLDDCENVSRQMSALLDVEDVVKSAYVLEVSSPGLDRPFKTDRDYERSIGRFVRIHCADENGMTLQVTGNLMEITDADLAIEESGVLRRIPREQVRKAHQEIRMPSQPVKGSRRKKKRSSL